MKLNTEMLEIEESSENNNNVWYKKDIPRVSSIVESHFPFTGTYAEEQYQLWLWKNNIKTSDYMEEAQGLWTFVHNSLESFILNKEIDTNSEVYRKCINEYNNWKVFFEEYKVKSKEPEVYLIDKDDKYQWTTDLICEIDWEKWIVDYKTWGIAKKRWKLPNKNRKPYGKLKKVSLQLSLYAKMAWIDNVAALWLRDDWYEFYKVPRISDNELNIIINKYNEDIKKG